MRDAELYTQLLGLVDPWFVDDVELSVNERSVVVRVDHHEGRRWPCPTCGADLPGLWDYQRLGWALRFYKRWYFWATHSRLQPVIDVAYTLKRHFHGIRNYFTAAPITNAAAEGLNSKIQMIKKMAYGYRNREHFKTAIFFHGGGLQLYP